MGLRSSPDAAVSTTVQVAVLLAHQTRGTLRTISGELEHGHERLRRAEDVSLAPPAQRPLQTTRLSRPVSPDTPPARSELDKPSSSPDGHAWAYRLARLMPDMRPVPVFSLPPVCHHMQCSRGLSNIDSRETVFILQMDRGGAAGHHRGRHTVTWYMWQCRDGYALSRS